MQNKKCEPQNKTEIKMDYSNRCNYNFAPVFVANKKQLTKRKKMPKNVIKNKKNKIKSRIAACKVTFTAYLKDSRSQPKSIIFGI